MKADSLDSFWVRATATRSPAKATISAMGRPPTVAPVCPLGTQPMAYDIADIEYFVIKKVSRPA
jgi:hypothetical protein